MALTIKNLKPSKPTIYFTSLLGTVFLIFMFLIFLSSHQENTTNESKVPQASDSVISQVLGMSNQQPSQRMPQQQMSEQVPSEFGPTKPVAISTPLPTPTKTPSPTETPTPTPTATPNPTSAPNNNSDTSGPVISSIKSNVEASKVTITWNTNEDADSKVEYGKTTSYGKNKESSTKTTSHLLELTDFEPNTLYYYRVISQDNSNNSTTSGNNQFTTLPAPSPTP